MKTIDELVTRLQGAFNTNYTVIQIEDIKDWMRKENISNNWLPDLYDLLVDHFKPTYHNPIPLRKDFVDIKNKAAERKAENAWMQLNEIKFVRSVLCTDVIIQETIKNMGGIDDFIAYRDKDNHWCRKDFLQRYIKLLQSGYFKDKKSEVLLCEYERQYPKYPQENFLSGLLIIGDKEKGKLLLQENLKIENKSEEMQSVGDIINNLHIGEGNE